MVVFMFLYLHDHSKLLSAERAASGSSQAESTERHRAVMEERRERMREQCKHYAGELRSQHGSIYHRAEPVNRCTGTFFNIDKRDYFICNVLKGGSTSWRFFFGENNITSAFLDECRPKGTCPSNPQLRLVQVRHPLERLLATWRHVFRSGGWKNLDGGANTRPEVRARMDGEFARFTWNYFIEEVGKPQ
jgi:hypothetical protein